MVRCLNRNEVCLNYGGCEIGPWGYMPNDDPQGSQERYGCARPDSGKALPGAAPFLDDAAVEGMLKDIDDISKLLKGFSVH